MDEWLYCPKCGARLDAGAVECRCCGAAAPGAPTVGTGEVAAQTGADQQLGILTTELREALAPALILLGRLGQGGMGTVFLARDPVLKRNVVVKVLSPELAHDTKSRRRFEREAEAAAAVSHPNVVGVYQVGTLPRTGTSYFVMRHVAGESLEAALPRGSPVPEARAKRIIGEIASALAAAHARGLVHRDIKPANIMLEADTNRVVVLDFGISAAVGLGRRAPTDTRLTEQGTSIGTPQYMSPEQAAGEDVTDRSDVYSLGLVAFELLVGRPPFEEPTPMALAAAHIHKLPPSVAGLRPDADPNLVQLVDSCLSKDPATRPSASAVAATLLPQEATRIEWPPPGLDPLRGRASRYLRSSTRFAAVVAGFAFATTGFLIDASQVSAVLALFGACGALWYAFTIGRAARHLPKAVYDARRVGYPRLMLLDVGIDDQPDTELLLNRVGPFARLSELEAGRLLRHRRIVFVTVAVLVGVALLGPVLALGFREADVAFGFPLAVLAAAGLTRWWLERPERRFRRQYLRAERGRRQVVVDSDLVFAWLVASGYGRASLGRHPWAERLLAGGFNGAIGATLMIGGLWVANLTYVQFSLYEDPLGNRESLMRGLRDARGAARQRFPVLTLDMQATSTPPPSASQLSVLLRDSTRRTAERLAGAAERVLFRSDPQASAAVMRPRLEPAAMYGPLEIWRKLAADALPLLWYRDAIAARRGERTDAGGDTSTIAVAAACQCNRALRSIGRFATLQAASAVLAATRGDEHEALRRAAEMVSIGRNLGRDPLTAASGSVVLARSADLLGALAPILGHPWLARDAAALATYRTAFDQAVGVFAGTPAIKSAVFPLYPESLLALASDTSLQPVARRGLARAAALSACYSGEDLFFNVDRDRERLVDSMLARVADLPEAATFGGFTRDLDWRRSGTPEGRVWATVFWAVPRVRHCRTLGLLGDTPSSP